MCRSNHLHTFRAIEYHNMYNDIHIFWYYQSLCVYKLEKALVEPGDWP
jgi:hypothetical protein